MFNNATIIHMTEENTAQEEAAQQEEAKEEGHEDAGTPPAQPEGGDDAAE